MYHPVPRHQIADAVHHLRNLFRQQRPEDERAVRAQERRELLVRNFLSNLSRTQKHPTLNTLLELSDAFSLTLDGVHQLFGYRTTQIRDLDYELNGSYTRIIESYPFERNSQVEIPARIRTDELKQDAFVKDLIEDWRSAVPIASLEGPAWKQKGAFYIQVGTEDSLGSSLPPGAIALVEPIPDGERKRPNPGVIYFLQFGNGYRCSRCVVTNNRLILLSAGKRSDGPKDFAFPTQARVVGRVRMFAVGLPLAGRPFIRDLRRPNRHAPLILPWEHGSLNTLFAAEHARFQRNYEERSRTREFLRAIFGNDFSSRTERRYRYPSGSLPHVDTLIQLSLTHVARYTDALRANGTLRSDRNRYSLQTLLEAEHLSDLKGQEAYAPPPDPAEQWEEHRREYGEWPSLLSLKFPNLSSIGGKVVRLARGVSIAGLEPSIRPGSFVAVEKVERLPNPEDNSAKHGWWRPLYLLQRGAEFACGPLEGSGDERTLAAAAPERTETIRISGTDTQYLHRVIGVAVPV
ncbi:hypothetical protein [Terriglobus albidus]|uniref:hypothetical protein n=1 Tax=Terriglobus albidus TaxID=1592106 RepID=UPI0021E042DA|nr:hypothetical protein [Terriglobus albidus]